MEKHPWIPMTEDIRAEMLQSMGKKEIADLFSNIPSKFQIKRDLDLPASHSEMEVAQRLTELASKNTPADTGRVFLGAGAALHYIPAAVPALAGQSEFVTSYTSYQPEISQGMLQTLFEYQSMMAELLSVEVVNSSMYDMASGLAEAILMCARVKKGRTTFLLPGSINPSHYQVSKTYAEPHGIELQKVDFDIQTGLMSLTDLESRLDSTVAGAYIENPSYLGFIETQVEKIADLTHNADALFVVGSDIMSLGVLRSPGDYDADIVVGEGQGLGSPVSFGGPLLGVFGCKDDMKLIRQLPGRLVGMTHTTEEPYERGFVLTLSPREQHIRREKATSNICSNQALVAVTAAVYAATMGPSAFRDLGETVAYKSHYAAKRLNEIKGVKAPAIGQSFWKEFVVQFETGMAAQTVHEGLLRRNLHGGKILTDEFPELGQSMLLCVTEKHSKEVIDEMVSSIAEIVQRGGAE
ncbi:MAG: aminomethyl-transferring glycine dehydrogenase subunit GcvPA [Candidatus Thorarchaeota archaeon]|nr:aminomethyl-transferring glycine dehydrogenase subunit GcvPA [Candidatus Thorarchaeota archaeon]